MIFGKQAALTILLASLAMPAASADFSDPTWPCVQRKVERLSAGLMWPAVIEPVDMDDATAAAVADLADTLALRRIMLEDVQPSVDTFAQTYNADIAMMGQVFQQVFDSLATRRGRIIEGIGDFSLSQIALSEKIETARVEMNTLLDAESPDYDRIDLLEEQIDWDQTIYTDRQQSITYLCETPVLLEKRLFAVAQMLSAAARDDG